MIHNFEFLPPDIDCAVHKLAGLGLSPGSEMYINHVMLILLYIWKTASPFSFPCIPVMGFGFIDDPKNFTGRLITSIDFCVEEFVIIFPKYYIHDKSNGLSFTDASQIWFQNSPVQNVNYIPMKTALIGVAEGWNSIITSYKAPWYLISAYDVEFFSGQLEIISRRFWIDSGQHSEQTNRIQETKINFVHTKWQNLPGGRGFNLFGLSRDVVDNCGLFDENIFPAFWEDRDYQFRLSLWPGSRIGTYKQIRPWHGERFTAPLLDSTSMTSDNFRKQFNYTSGTIYLGPKWRAAMKAASDSNVRYVVNKWGCDMKLAKIKHHLLDCKYLTPFNMSVPIGYWKRDESRLQRVIETYGF